MRILLLCSAFNGLSQRVHRELELLGCEVSVQLATAAADMQEVVAEYQPDLIVCPYLVHRIPDEVWQKTTCLVVHPGIEGDRGPSSLDWAIVNNASEWGVTLLQADKEMDAGDIWATANFPMRATGKAGHYRREVTATAVALIKRALREIDQSDFKPRPLQPERAPGSLMPCMSQSVRSIDWENDSTDTVINKLRAADSIPGVCEEIGDQTVYLFGVRPESQLTGKAGEFIAHSNGAVCRATRDGAVWIPRAKLKDGIKLPAARVLLPLLKNPPRELEQIAEAVEDIRCERIGDVAYLYFNFAGGAMSTEQCQRLLRHYRELQDSDARVIALMGGEDFWGNGIQLNVIEAAEDPAQESWENINAIDDLVEAIINTPKQITVAALRNNAGAGGAIMPLACDHIVLREGVVLNPHYQAMGLYGSEYWTYLLPRRVGQKQAEALTKNCMPILATEALQMGFGDEIFDENWEIYQRELENFCERLSQSRDLEAQLRAKAEMRASDERRRPLQQYRDDELEKMWAIFSDPEAEYHKARSDFVYKKPVVETPERLRKRKHFGQRAVFS